MPRDYVNKYQKLADHEWLREQVLTRPLRDIAKEVGCSYSAVVHTTRKHGISPPRFRKARQSDGWKDKLKVALKEKYPNGRFGSDAANWRGGLRRVGTKSGYIGVYSPEHPYVNKDGYVMQHRLVMEAHLGRYLTGTEMVHHINGDKKDNRLENLQLVSGKLEHSRAHFDAVKVLQLLRQDPVLAKRIAEIESQLNKT